MKAEKRIILKNLGLALAATPFVSFALIIITTLFGALDDLVTKIQLAGYMWLILIIGYFLSLIYFTYGVTIRRDIKRKSLVNGLIFYWEEQLEKRGKAQPSDEEIKSVKEMLIERVKLWAWSEPKLWAENFPNEKYSKYLFGLMENFITYYEKQKSDIK